MSIRGSRLLPSLLILVGAHAQDFRATLTGRVLDPAGAGVAGAKVRVINPANGETRPAVTDAGGNYLVPLLNPATYTLRAEHEGFKTAVREGLELNVNQTATVDVTLELGSMNTQVTVTAETPLLDDANADRGGLVDEQSVKEYPLNARNPFMLAMLAPGVNFDGELTYQRPFDNGAIAEWSINGSQRKNEFLLDGAPNNAQAGGNNIAYVPPVDAVQEFKIQSNAYDAQYGRSAGGIINVALKSGGNRFHGAAYEFARRSAWDANSFQNNARCVSFVNGRCNGAPKDGHYLDQYGIQVDGPVLIPKLYNGRNKTFFLLNGENYREGSPQPLILSVPEPEMRHGDFGKLVDPRNRPIVIYDPNTGGQVGTQWVREPFAGNVIPASRINPTAALLIKYFPSPNTVTPGVNYSTSNYFISGGEGSARDRFYNVITKIDQNLGDKHHVFLRYGQNDRTEMRTTNGIFDKPGADGQLPLRRANWTGSLNWTSSLRPTLLLDIKTSMSRFIDPSTAEANKDFDLIGAGFSPRLVSQLPFGSYFPRISISGFQALGRSPYFGGSASNTFTVQPSLTQYRGARTWRAGLDLRWTQYSTRNSGAVLSFSAADTFTRADYSRSDGLSGAGLASWLLGMPTSGAVTINMFPIYMYRYFAPWVQNDWKLTRKLTLNAGFRWDVNAPPVERYNRMNRGFDPEATSPANALIDASLYPYMKFPIRGGLDFAGVDGDARGAADPYYHTYQPRIGLAYAVGKRTVLRGGWGRYFINPNNDYLQTTGYSQSTSLNVSGDSNRTALPALLADPFPVINQPVGNAKGLMTFAGNGFNFVNTHFKIPSMDSFSVDIQHAFSSRARLSIGFVGSRGRRLQTTKAFNEDDSSIRDQCNYLLGATSQALCTANLSNPFRNVPGFEGTAHYANAQRSRYELSRPFPQFTSGLNELMRNDGLSWYNSGQVSFLYRTRNGLNLNTNYTFSKSIEQNGYLDTLHNVMQRGLTSNDRPHKFVYSMIWQLPMGRGRRWFHGLHAWAGHAVSGWEATTIFQVQSGRPWGLPGNVLYLKDAKNPQFTWDAPRIQAAVPCVKNWDNTNRITWQQYSVDAGCSDANWMILPNYNPRYTPYYAGNIRLQTIRLMDASLNKMTRLTERVNLQLRFEGFNVLNSFFINSRQFNNDPTNANFGSLIKAEVSAPNSNYPRQVQMAVKLIW
ncbi:MAG: TonB-dependent receptor [Acidobacteria bacterium]|nr:TonB-dependent receptor [Acidobacteriota bacterium]